MKIYNWLRCLPVGALSGWAVMHKLLIVIPLLFLLAGTAAANSNDCELIQINSTHWYFETTQTDLDYGTYNYQAFANNISTDYRTLEYSRAFVNPTFVATAGTFVLAAGAFLYRAGGWLNRRRKRW